MQGRLTINLKHLKENYQLLKKIASPAAVASVVKADAYGLGAKNIAPALYDAGCRFFFVATLDEALNLRQTIDKNSQIAVLQENLYKQENAFIKNDLLPVLNSRKDIEIWHAFCKKEQKKYSALIHIDTGMHRLGLEKEDIKWLTQKTEIFETISIPYLMSHLAHSELEDDRNEKQRQTLEKFIQCLPKIPISFANSGGIFLGPCFHYQQVRPGIALYGMDPRPQSLTKIKPVVTLEAPILQIKKLEENQEIGYSGTFTTKRQTAIAAVALGYADGWPRLLSNKGHAYYKGYKLPIRGKISMDSLILDITDSPILPKVGDFIEFIGPHQSLQQIAQDAQTIGYEILTNLGCRLKRYYTQ